MKRISVILAVFCLFGAIIWADGDGLSRPINAEERAFMLNCYQKALEFLPPAPEGVDKKPQEFTTPISLGLGTERYPIPLNFYCEYTKKADMQKMLDMAADSKGIEEMSEQMNKISEEMEKAINAGETDKIVGLQAKLQAVMSGNATMQKMQGSIEEQKMQSLHCEVSINPNGADYFLYKDIQVPANATYAIRRLKTTPNHSFSTTDTVLFFGAFGKKLVNDTFEIYAPRVEAKSTKVHRLIISLQGEAALADEYIAKMNLAGFGALTR
ncbi:MAG: hypothetical protein KKB51_17620 [Candidatus Riflebacteria bacterium]|nr:hypothetical protein [Candidatus Riflebacteria bacterium]